MLQRAVRIKPSDDGANYWCSVALGRAGRNREAVPYLEKAVGAHPNALDTRVYLFSTYLVAGQSAKAFALFPAVVSVLAAALMSIYAVGLALLLYFSFKSTVSQFPGLFFSLGWIMLLLEGQIAFLFFLGVLPLPKLTEGPLTAACLASLPLIPVALAGFSRKPWGVPFRWPPRLGGWKIVACGGLLLLCSLILDGGFAKIVFRQTGHAGPLQRTAPFIREAILASPVIAILTVALVIPIVEEILIRGLLYGALEKRLRTGWIIFVTSLVFAAMHLEWVGFIPLFFMGFILGWARWRSGSIGLPILLHSLNNSLAVVVLATRGNP
jgi:membrane protease YdiL (CAAX protease family)